MSILTAGAQWCSREGQWTKHFQGKPVVEHATQEAHQGMVPATSHLQMGKTSGVMWTLSIQQMPRTSSTGSHLLNDSFLKRSAGAKLDLLTDLLVANTRQHLTFERFGLRFLSERRVLKCSAPEPGTVVDSVLTYRDH